MEKYLFIYYPNPKSLEIKMVHEVEFQSTLVQL